MFYIIQEFMAKGKIVKKVIGFIGLGVLVAGGVIASTQKGRDTVVSIVDEIKEVVTSKYQKDLESAQNLQFNYETSTYSWDPVEGAEAYSVYIQLNNKGCVETKIKNNYITVEDLGYIKYQGDIITLNVKAYNEYDVSRLSSANFTVQKTDEIVYDNAIKVFKNFTRADQITSINYLSFNEGNASGTLNYVKNNKNYFKIFNLDCERYRNTESDRIFFENVNDLVDVHNVGTEISGIVFKFDQVEKLLANRLDIDFSTVTQITMYQRDRVGRDKWYDIYVQFSDGDKIIHKNYTLTYSWNFLGYSQEEMLQLAVDGSDKFDLIETLSFEQNKNDNKQYLDGINEILEQSLQEETLEMQ